MIRRRTCWRTRRCWGPFQRRVREDPSLLWSISTSGTPNTRLCWVSISTLVAGSPVVVWQYVNVGWWVHRRCSLKFQRRWSVHPSLLSNKPIKTGFDKDRRWSSSPAHKIWVIPFKFQKQSYTLVISYKEQTNITHMVFTFPRFRQQQTLSCHPLRWL